jgi:hypothetical protein
LHKQPAAAAAASSLTLQQQWVLGKPRWDQLLQQRVLSQFNPVHLQQLQWMKLAAAEAA